jgi:poly(3-hydroxybutyrate) depolymerase
MTRYLRKIQRNAMVVLSAVVLMFSLSGAKSSADTDEQFLTWTYQNAPMGLYLPAKTDKPVPVVMFLHGCHCESVTQYLWIVPALNAIEPCAVFIPTAPETPNTPYPCADWGGTYDLNLRPQMINALHELDSLIKVYGFDKQREYLYGESMGGEGVYRLLMDMPTRFAGAVDAAGYTVNKGAAQMAKTPLWIFIGSGDEMSPIDSTRTIYNSILSAGGTQVKLTEYPGLTHVAGIEKAREEPGLLEWLLEKKRTTGIIKRSAMRNENVQGTSHFTFSNGNLNFSTSLPERSVVTLFDLNGIMLFKTVTGQKQIKLPPEITGRNVLWNVTNTQFNISGKLSLY